MDLIKLGWNSMWHEHFLQFFSEQGYIAGRIVAEHKNLYKVNTNKGELTGEVSGKMRFNALERSDYPAVGDWVCVTDHGDRAIIHNVLPRQSKISRKVAGAVTEEQIVAANVDHVFIVVSLNHDFKLRRIERYLALAWESGVSPVILLSKADLCMNVEQKLKHAQKIALNAPVHPISCQDNMGLHQLQPYLKQGQTVAVLGSSGVGKSTLINHLVGDTVQRVSEIREGDDRGRHTTTHRELVLLPSGALLLDTPGMRELQLWGTDEGLNTTFEDIETLSKNCFFKDCRHNREPDCAVKKAIENGTLEARRLYSYQTMGSEISHFSKKVVENDRKVEKEKGKKAVRRMVDKERGKENAKFRRGLKKGH